MNDDKNKKFESELEEENTPKDFKTKKEKKDEIAKLKIQILEAKAEGENWKNKFYGVYADMENTRKSLEKDRLEVLKYRTLGFVESLLQVLDNFHLALGVEPSDEKTKNYLIGFNYIYKQLLSILEEEGVSSITPKIDDQFDANTMHAIDVEYIEGCKPNKVVKVYANGYKLHERLIRAASVIVSTDKPVEKKEENKEIDPSDLN